MEESIYVVRETTIENKDNQQVRVVIIGVRDEKNGIIIPHPLTDFIRNRYEYVGVSLSYQRNAAREIVKFLNFILAKVKENDYEFAELKLKGVKGLTRLHASRYITYLTTVKKLKRVTVKTIEAYLTNFYSFLLEQELLEEVFEIKQYKNARGRTSMESPFKNAKYNTVYPSTSEKPQKISKLKDFDENRYRIVKEFIQHAEYECEEIALAIALQFYGGLRRGEIVNLTRDSIHLELNANNNIKSITVDVFDNQQKLFSHLKDTSKEQVKKERKQTILPTDLLFDLYKRHIKRLERIKTRDKQILFYSKNGNPLSGTNYERKFNRVRDSFIELLGKTKGRYGDYKLLSETYWSTHIGRGIFTNFLLDMGLSVTQIAIARGDSNIESAMEYVDKKIAVKNINNIIEVLNNTPDEAFGKIDINTINNKWNKGMYND